VVDRGGTVTSTLGAQLALGRSTRRQRVRVYVGFEGLAWADYTLVQTQLVTDITWKDGAYTFRCMDVQREMRKDIFDLAKTTARRHHRRGRDHVDVVSTAAFTMVAHGTSYTDAPNADGRLHQDRGRGHPLHRQDLDAVHRLHARRAQHAAGAARGRPHRLGRPAHAGRGVRLPRAAGGEADVRAPHRHALQPGRRDAARDLAHGRRPGYVQLADFTASRICGIRPTTQGLPGPLRGPEEAGRQEAFIEKELALLSACSCRSTRAARSGCARWRTVLAGAAYTQLLDESNVVKSGELKHDFESLHNILQVSGTGSRCDRISRASTSSSTATRSRCTARPTR
jgi:hypothetical protein